MTVSLGKPMDAPVVESSSDRPEAGGRERGDAGDGHVSQPVVWDRRRFPVVSSFGRTVDVTDVHVGLQRSCPAGLCRDPSRTPFDTR